jgi:hypothetical protein
MMKHVLFLGSMSAWLFAPVAQAATYFVDGGLGSASCSDYAPSTRSCGGGNSTAYRALSGAAGVANPGDTVEIRGGTYSMSADTTNTLSRSGTEASPIVYRGYQSEAAVFKGTYDVDSDGDGIRNWDDNNGSGDAPGSASGDRGIGIRITGNYIHVSKVRIGWMYQCVDVAGSYNVVEEVVAHDCWQGGLMVDNGDFNIVRYSAGFRIRHRSGGSIESPESASSIVRGNVFYRSLFWKNGRQLPNGELVAPIDGDPNGGGNSDGLGASKDCADLVSGYALCRETTMQENIAWQNADDCYDTSIGGSWIINNIGDDCGPHGRVGWKMLRAQIGMKFSGGIFHGYGAQDSLDWGTRVRFEDTSSTATNSFVLHTLATGAASQPGIQVSEVADTSRCTISNNVAWDNASDFSTSGCVASRNFGGDTGVANASFDSANARSAAETCLSTAPHVTSVRECWQNLYDAYYNAYTPMSGSPLIDGGVVIGGYHCPAADDAGQDVDAPCRHWRGAAPDQGPFEFGILGNPDKTRCNAVGLSACSPLRRPEAPTSVSVE